jgi:thioredoxin 1
MKIVFYFTAEWCAPCKKTRPVVEDLKREGFQFQIIDADYEQLLAKRFEVKSVPTFILIENEKEIKRITGAQTKKSLLEFIENE